MNEKQDNFNELALIARRLGAAAFGVADVGRMKADGLKPPVEELMKYPYGVSVGFRLSDALMETLVNGPTTTYRYHYRQVNAHLDRIALELCDAIQAKGYDAFPVPSSHIVDWEKNTGDLSHKWVAHYAGLGWFGLNNLLINPKYGARMRYVTVMTDMPLITGEPHKGSCEDCTDCISVCPASAIKNSRDDFNLEACDAQLKIFRDKWKIGQQICGLCIKACKGNAEGRSKKSK